MASRWSGDTAAGAAGRRVAAAGRAGAALFTANALRPEAARAFVTLFETALRAGEVFLRAETAFFVVEAARFELLRAALALRADALRAGALRVLRPAEAEEREDVRRAAVFLPALRADVFFAARLRAGRAALPALLVGPFRPAAFRAAGRLLFALAIVAVLSVWLVDTTPITSVSSIAYPNSGSRPPRRALSADSQLRGAGPRPQARQSNDRGGLARHVER